MSNFGKTIAAISTPPGKGGVALIRISGDEARQIADRCFIPRGGEPLSSKPARTAVYGDVILSGERIDDAVATVYTAPNSYTGEDIVEISCHGGVLITESVLSAALAAGAVMAESGEFTRRAFVNGKLSLSDAEAIANLLEAKSMEQIRLSSKHSRGKLSTRVDGIREKMLALMSELFAKIDYPDEDLADIGDEEMLGRLNAILCDIDALMSTYRTGRAVSQGVDCAICGLPNAGKSSLYNALLGEDSAIVTEYAGTTRDVLHESVNVGKILLNLHDTAGIRETDNPVERIGVSRSIQCIQDAELIIYVLDASAAPDAQDIEMVEMLKKMGKSTVYAMNKSDVGVHPEAELLLADCERKVRISAAEGDISELTALIEQMYYDESLTIGEDAIVASARQYAALVKAREHIALSCGAFEAGLACDVASSDLELAIGAISELDGREVSESVVARIFSHFCVGK